MNGGFSLSISSIWLQLGLVAVLGAAATYWRRQLVIPVWVVAAVMAWRVFRVLPPRDFIEFASPEYRGVFVLFWRHAYVATAAAVLVPLAVAIWRSWPARPNEEL